jgi:hypothetical protein
MKKRDRKKGPPELRELTRYWSRITPEARAISRTILGWPITPPKTTRSAASIAGIQRALHDQACKDACRRIGVLD